MNIAWVQDYSRPHGGAELSNRCVVEAGTKRGHDIVGVSPLWFPAQVLREADAIIVNNFWQFEPHQAKAVRDALAVKPYVKYEHDYREIRRKDQAREMFSGSRLNVFLSPKHLRDHQEALGITGFALPLAIREKDFYPVKGITRVYQTALVVGGWVRGGKTGNDLMDYFQKRPDLSFTSIGIRVPGMKFLHHVPLGDMKDVYSAFEYLVHLPSFKCAGERVIFEAALCGCKVISNGNAGHTSWGYDLNDTEGLREILREAPVKFWKLVEERCT